MDFDLTEEQKMFWDSIADFCDHEIAPLVDEAEAKEEFPFPLFKKLGSLGFLCCRYPEQYGGAAADKVCECLYMEELNRVCCSETAQKIVVDAMQMFGGYGYMMEYPIQRIWRDSRVLSITEGTSEIQHLIIAGELKL